MRPVYEDHKAAGTVRKGVAYTMSDEYVAGLNRGEDGAIYALAYQRDAETELRRDIEASKATIAYIPRTDQSGLDRFAAGYVDGWDQHMATHADDAS
jgi:hypothetical protein